MNNKKSLSENYDDYVLQYAKEYTVSELQERAKYIKKNFKSLTKAVEHYNKIKEDNPIARVGVYAICYPPHTQMPVNQIISVK
tara:strand:+ start:367 stop:615 length:249 start_codon:yes stop_codon:yes gene_type:complete